MSDTANKAPLLRVNDLHVFYGAIHAIKGISLEVNNGEIVTLIGANGAGKSTTLNTIAGLLKPRQGTVELNGQVLNGLGASRIVPKGLSLCPEGRRIFQQMTVRENLEMGCYTRPNSEIAGSLDEMFQRFPRLKEREKQIAGTLSGGEQQMLAMARALMSKPSLRAQKDQRGQQRDPRRHPPGTHRLRDQHPQHRLAGSGQRRRRDPPSGHREQRIHLHLAGHRARAAGRAGRNHADDLDH